MISVVLAAAMAAIPRPLPPEPGCPGAEFSVPRGTVPRDVSPDPRPPLRPEPR